MTPGTEKLVDAIDAARNAQAIGLYHWDRLTMGNVPMDGDTIIMPDGAWTLKHNMSPMGWCLRKDGAAHPVIGIHAGMADLMAAIWTHGHALMDKGAK